MRYYDRWLESEIERFKVIQRKSRQTLLIQSIFVIPGCILAIAAINLISGGELSAAMSMGARYGLLFGGAVTIFCLLGLLSYRQPERFKNGAAKECNRQLQGDAWKEEFAMQMLGLDENSQLIKLKFKSDKKNDFDFISVTKDYAVWTNILGNIWIVRLKDTALVEFDVKQHMHTLDAGDKNVVRFENHYPIFFFYRQNETLHMAKKKADQFFVFYQKSHQAEFIDALRKVSGLEI